MKKFLAVLCIGCFCISAVNSYFEKTSTALADGVIRFHILANSDTKEDQSLKLKVRDRIIKEMEPLFDENGDIPGARDIIIANMEKIKSIAEDEVKKQGFDYDVSVSLGQSYFPTKEYGDVVLPTGTYEALKIKIGNAKGQNWWCVLFPPLCFVDESCVSGSNSTGKLVSNVGKDNAELIKKEKSPGVKLKFKSYELWQNGKQKIACFFGQ